MSSSDAVFYKYTELSASGKISDYPVKLGGIFCASSSSGTVKIWDNNAASGAVVVNTFNIVANTWYSLPFNLMNGCFITVGGTADITVAWL